MAMSIRFMAGCVLWSVLGLSVGDVLAGLRRVVAI